MKKSFFCFFFCLSVIFFQRMKQNKTKKQHCAARRRQNLKWKVIQQDGLKDTDITLLWLFDRFMTWIRPISHTNNILLNPKRERYIICLHAFGHKHLLILPTAEADEAWFTDESESRSWCLEVACFLWTSPNCSFWFFYVWRAARGDRVSILVSKISLFEFGKWLKQTLMCFLLVWCFEENS